MKKTNNLKENDNKFLEFYIKFSIFIGIFYIFDMYKINILMPLKSFNELIYSIFISIFTMAIVFALSVYLILNIYSIIHFIKLKFNKIILIIPIMYIFISSLGLTISFISLYTLIPILSYFSYLQIIMYTFIILFSIYMYNKFKFPKNKKNTIEIIVILSYLVFVFISSVISLFNPNNISFIMSIFILSLIILSIYGIIKQNKRLAFVCLILLMIIYIINFIIFFIDIDSQIEFIKMNLDTTVVLSKNILIFNNVFSLIFQLFSFSLILGYIRKEKSILIK